MKHFEYADHISDYLQAIKDCPEFVVANKPGGVTIIDYNVVKDSTFPDPKKAATPKERRNYILRRDCRGIVFNTYSGKIIHRRLHKFFNVNENEETLLEKIDLTEPHVILEKLDGSLVTSLWTLNGLTWGTKMGETDVAKHAAEFVKQHKQYEDFAHECRELDLTPMFEWCSRKSRIVIDYPEDQLILIAVRCNLTGNYISYNKMLTYGQRFNIPVVKAYPGTINTMKKLIETVVDMQGVEGFVVRFDSGKMVKVKSAEYITLHKAKDALTFEKNVIKIIINNKTDELKQLLTDNNLHRLTKFEHDFWENLNNTVNSLVQLRETTQTTDRKDYAINFVQKQPKKYHPFLYAMWEYTPQYVLQLVKEVVDQSCSSQTTINHNKWVWGNIDWNNY
jgi:RNA ligase